jgi:glycosyltransferase involved in cell wall biosynthesis
MAEEKLSKIKIAYLSDRLGPYHFASLNAANNYAEIIVVEFSKFDLTYLWDVISEPSKFQRVTLFKDYPINMQPISEIIRRMRNILDDISPQVVAISGWDETASLIALQWCLESKTPTIMMSDSQEHDEPRVWWKEYIKRRIVRLTSAGFVAGTSHYAYLKSLGMVSEMIVKGCDVVDNNYFEQGAIKARQDHVSLRKQYSLPENYFLVSARFVPKKNILRILMAYSNYLQYAGKIPWKLILLGDGLLKAEITDLRDELGLSENVLLPGFIQYNCLPVYYGLAGAFILASTTEQWGLVVNEAMASSLPVIVSNRCGCAPDLVKHGYNGFLFDPYDVNSLSLHLKYIAGDECKRDLLGNNSLKIIRDWDLNLFARNLCQAAELAQKAPEVLQGSFDTVLFWSLIHRPRHYLLSNLLGDKTKKISFP